VTIFSRLLARLGYVRLEDHDLELARDGSVVRRSHGALEGGAVKVAPRGPTVDAPASGAPEPAAPTVPVSDDVEVNSDYLARMEVALADTAKLPLGLRGDKPCAPQDWAEGTLDESPTIRQRAPRPTPTTNRFRRGRARRPSEQTTAKNPALPRPQPPGDPSYRPSITRRGLGFDHALANRRPVDWEDEDNTTSPVIYLDAEVPPGQTIVLDEADLVPLDDVLAYLEVGDQTKLHTRAQSDTVPMWHDDED
jgi:hypothetical protein